MLSKKQAIAGDASAQYNLGIMYYRGHGVSQEYIQSFFWFSLAALRASGDEYKQASDARDRAAKRLTPEKLMEAQRMI
jgi:TPR repeat protein